MKDRFEIQSVLNAVDGGTPVYVLNCSIAPAIAPEADWAVRDLTTEQATAIVRVAQRAMDENHGWLKSRVGHEATAAVARDVLGAWTIGVDRTQWEGDGYGLVIQLKGRPQEGAILDRAQMEAMGYSFRLIYQIGKSLSRRVRYTEEVSAAQRGEIEALKAELAAVKAQGERFREIFTGLLTPYIIDIAYRMAHNPSADHVPADEMRRFLRIEALATGSPALSEATAPSAELAVDPVRMESEVELKEAGERIVLPDVVVRYGISQEAWLALSPAERVDQLDRMVQDEKDRGW